MSQRRTTRGEHLAKMLSSMRTPNREGQITSRRSSRSAGSEKRKTQLDEYTRCSGEEGSSRSSFIVSFEVNNTSI